MTTKTRLQAFAKRLRYHEHTYHDKLGRLYAWDGWFARDGKLYHGDVEVDPAALRDGHGVRLWEDYIGK